MYNVILLSLLSFAATTSGTDINIYSLQVFSIPILPQYFNWTSDEGRNEYRYEASLLNYPDLPPWIHYTYNSKIHRGYLYGVAPKDQKNFKLEIIALNNKTYETRSKVLEVVVSESDNVSKYQIQLKVNNWNVEDMFDENRTETLFDIFRKEIWKNATDLQLTFLAPAVELGARYPLKPGEVIGTVLRLGSSTPFSTNLQNFEKDLQPTSKRFSSCQFKQASFDRLLPDFKFDWCYFKMIEESYGPQQQESARRDTSASMTSSSREHRPEFRWSQNRKAELPRRGYRRELLASVIVPAVLLLLLVGFLSAALCLNQDDLISLKGKRDSALLMDNGGTNGVQMIQYASNSLHRGTLRSLSAAKALGSLTPSESLSINRSPRIAKDHSNLYIRPNPPPYISSNNFGGQGIRSDF